MSATGVPDDVDTYRRHATELIRYATVLVGPDDAPDVVTDAVLAAFGSPQWPAVENRRAYLYRAVLTRSMSTVVRRRGAGGGKRSSPCGRRCGSTRRTRRSTPTAPSPRSASSSAP